MTRTSRSALRQLMTADLKVRTTTVALRETPDLKVGPTSVPRDAGDVSPDPGVCFDVLLASLLQVNPPAVQVDRRALPLPVERH